jgi:aryl-alcohol dehydrogenase-like predicted oxidoreductase
LRYVRLGGSGLTISRLILGAASFGDTVSAEAAREIVAAALDAGVSTFDTADVYAAGRSEQILGAALASVRERVVLCSKVGLRVGDSDADHALVAGAGPVDHARRWTGGIAPTDSGLSRKHIMTAVEATLRRVGTDYIDLYQVHRFDPGVPLEETLSVLDDLVRAGKVRYLGCSGFAAWQLVRALWVSDRDRLAAFSSLQVRYNVADRAAESELLPACTATGVGVLAFQVLAGGVLVGSAADGTAPATSRASRAAVAKRFGTEQFGARTARVRQLAAAAGVSAPVACLAWVLAQPAVCAAIVGASSVAKLGDLLAAAELELDPQLTAALTDVAR